MSKLTLPLNIKVLVWAREAMGYEPAAVAQKLHVDDKKILVWESGNAQPTLRQLEDLSDLYKQPLVTFFQDKTPETPLWPTDYRKFPDKREHLLSAETRSAIWEAQWRQSVAANLRKEFGEQFYAKLQKLRLGPDPEAAADELRSKIGPTIDTQIKWAKQPMNLFRNWRDVLESIGVLVFKFDFPKDDTRGFSLPDAVAPIVAVSSEDYTNAAIFSLFHELGHLLLRGSSTCNFLEFTEDNKSERDKTEAICNHFSGAFLVPKAVLLNSELVKRTKANEWDNEKLLELASFFGVSREVILRRLVILGYVSLTFYREWRKKQKEYWEYHWTPPKPFPVPLGYARKVLSSQGRAYAGTVLEAYSRKVINLSEASEYLAVKSKHIRSIETVLRGKE